VSPSSQKPLNEENHLPAATAADTRVAVTPDARTHMDCIRCLDHHPVNNVCRAAAAEWRREHRHFPNLTYASAYEQALLDDLLGG
jgi:hypothetical protein